MDTTVSATAKPPRLMDQVRHAICLRHYSIRTERAYVYWISRYIRFNGMRHPREMGAREVTAYLPIWPRSAMWLRQSSSRWYLFTIELMRGETDAED